MKRIIVFCSKVAKASEARQYLGKWFSAAGFKRIRYYNIDYKAARLEKEMEDFQNDNYDGIKVAISVNMLNEGVHIPRVDGVIMLRSTISRIIIEQQIGRCLTTDNKTRTPVILDLVNNMDLIRYDGYSFESADSSVDSSKEKEKKEGFPFKVIDECRDIRMFLEQIESEFSPTIWTREMVAEEVAKYTYWNDFYTKSRKAYHAAIRNNWNDLLESLVKKFNKHTEEDIWKAVHESSNYHAFFENSILWNAAYRMGMIPKIKEYYGITQIKRDDVIAALKRVTSKSEFRKQVSFYNYLKKNKDDTEITNLYNSLKGISYGEANIEECIKSCETKTEFKKRFPTQYAKIQSRRKDLYKRLWEIYQQLASFDKKNTNNYELSKEKASLCSTPSEFYKRHRRYYTQARKNGWLDEFFPNSEVLDKEKCRQLALESGKRKLFSKKYSSAYYMSRKNGWLDEFFPESVRVNYNHDKCKELAEKCSSRTDFQVTYQRAYENSRLNGWLDEFFPKTK